jgi:hypothetical protein
MIMSATRLTTKSDLLSKIEKSWAALDSLLTRLTESQMTSLRDQAGWNVKDHLIHLAVWEDSVAALFRGEPRHQALGVDESTYRTASFDEVNARIREQRKDTPLAAALEQLRGSHATLMAFVEGKSDADLGKQARDLFPALPEGDHRLLIDIIDENTAGHFDEHRPWIEALLASA